MKNQLIPVESTGGRAVDDTLNEIVSSSSSSPVTFCDSGDTSGSTDERGKDIR